MIIFNFYDSVRTQIHFVNSVPKICYSTDNCAIIEKSLKMSTVNATYESNTHVHDSRMHLGVYPVHPPSAVQVRVELSDRLNPGRQVK